MNPRLALALTAAVAALAACGGEGGGGPDGGAGGDAAPTMVTVTGSTSEIGLGGRTPIAGVMVAAYEEGASTPAATATSDAQGNYTITITSTGQPLSGYLLGTQAGKLNNYLYPTGPLTADIAGASVLMLTQGTWDTAGTLAGVNQTPGMGWIGVQVYTASNMPVAGVVVSSTPAGTVKYNNANGLPTRNATMTAADGLAYIFNVAPGNVTISATGGGMTFTSHPVNARADQITTTLIQP